MFGRKKNKDVDWQSGLGQPVPAQPATPATPATPAPAPEAGIDLTQIPGLTPGQARVVKMTAKLAGQPHIQVMGSPSPEQYKQAMDMAEKFMNADLDGDGKVAGGAPAAGPSGMASMFSAMSAGAAPAAPAETDMVSQLERLAKLHDSGALTDEEFAAEKAKLIGS